GAPSVGNVTVEADSTASATSDGIAAAGGIVSGAGAVVNAEVTPKATAFIGDGANVQITGQLTVRSNFNGDASATSRGANVSLGAVGSTNSEATLRPAVTTYVGSGATLGIGGGLTLESINATSQGAMATSNASQGSLIGGNGATATATGG